MMKKNGKLAKIYLTILILLIYLPIVLVVIYSFNGSRISSVWGGFSLMWYRTLFADQAMWEALRNSVVLACSASTLAGIIGTLAAVGFYRIQPRSKNFMESLALLPIMTPEIILAMVFMVFFATIGLPFGMTTLILSHTTFCVPYVYMLTKARLVGLDPSLVEAAQDLGASGRRAFYDITLPLIAPAVGSGMLLGFAMSFDDVIISIFVTGATVSTLPIKIYTQIRTGVTPEINALSTMLLLGTIVVIAASVLVGRLGKNSAPSQ